MALWLCLAVVLLRRAGLRRGQRVQVWLGLRMWVVWHQMLRCRGALRAGHRCIGAPAVANVVAHCLLQLFVMVDIALRPEVVAIRWRLAGL